MALTSALFTGLSGLDVNTAQLNVVGNNIANANTTAFKASRVLFSPQFYVTDSAGAAPTANTGGANPSQHGLGASVASIEADFTPGTIQSTGVTSDLAIDGAGFFVVKNAGSQQYTRNGAFSLNSTNQLVTSSGAYVQGYAADKTGNVTPGLLSNLTVPLGESSSTTATTKVIMEGNLNASGPVAAGASILNSSDITAVGGAAPPTTATLLTGIASAASNATPLFNTGDTLSLTGTKGLNPLATQTFTVTATSTVQDLLSFYQQGLTIDPTVPNPGGTIPGATLQVDPASANPNNLQIAIIGNEGAANALAISGSGFSNQNGFSPLSFANGASGGVQSNPIGESVHTPFTTYDSLGNPVNVNVTAVLESTGNTGNTWRFTASSPDNTTGGPVLGNGTLTFDANGNLKSSSGTTLNINRSGTGAQSPMSVSLDFSRMTELSGTTSTMLMGSQDGIPPGVLRSYSIGTDGVITGAYSNGMQRSLGQVAVASFANPQGLNNIGSSIYAQAANSGVAIVTAPQQQGTGLIRSGALELSNVDLSKEFTNLIIASTGFSASSKVITTSDQLIQELLQSTH